MKKTCALIQVRMKSERLPGKALMNIDGMNAIERIIENLKPSKYIDEIILCTTIDKEDDLLEQFARNSSIPFFRGDIDHVVKRFYDAALKYNADTIVRITGDCPAITYESVDLLIRSHLETGAEYTLIESEKTPVGAFTQVISFNAFEKLLRYDLDFSYGEYMLYYFTNNPQVFSINTVAAPRIYQHPEYRLTLDYQEDMNMFIAMYQKMREEKLEVTLSNILLILRKYPEISRLNAHLIEKYKNIYDDLMGKLTQATTISRKV